MKTLATLTRHGITYLVGLLTAWLTLHLTAPEDLKAAVAAVEALVEPLVVISGFVAVVLARLAMPVVNKIFRRSAGEETGGASGGMSLLWLVGMTMICTAAVGTLPSCAPGTAGFSPVTGYVTYTDPQTGAQVGMKVGEPGRTSSK